MFPAWTPSALRDVNVFMTCSQWAVCCGVGVKGQEVEDIVYDNIADQYCM